MTTLSFIYMSLADSTVSGAHPFPVHFETGISQSMAWSLLNRYIVSCPAGTPKIVSLLSTPKFPT